MNKKVKKSEGKDRKDKPGGDAQGWPKCSVCGKVMYFPKDWEKGKHSWH